eukprot:SAG22_NODE_2295_length_2747_cov_227.286631_3_plen_226_part_00
MIEGLGQDNLKLTNSLKRIKAEVQGVLVRGEVNGDEGEDDGDEDDELSDDPYPEVDEDDEGEEDDEEIPAEKKGEDDEEIPAEKKGPEGKKRKATFEEKKDEERQKKQKKNNDLVEGVTHDVVEWNEKKMEVLMDTSQRFTGKQTDQDKRENKIPEPTERGKLLSYFWYNEVSEVDIERVRIRIFPMTARGRQLLVDKKKRMLDHVFNNAGYVQIFNSLVVLKVL